MKKVFLALIFAAACAFGASAQKFALVDMEYILKNIPAYEMANEQLNQVSTRWQKEVETKAKEAETLYKNYQADMVFLTDEQKKKKEEESFDFDSEDGEEKATRNYVPLNFEKAGEKVTVFVSKAGDVFEKTVDMVKQKVSGANAEDDDYVLDEGDDDFDVESLDLDDETPVAVVEDILADDTDAQ